MYGDISMKTSCFDFTIVFPLWQSIHANPGTMLLKNLIIIDSSNLICFSKSIAL